MKGIGIGVSDFKEWKQKIVIMWILTENQESEDMI